MLASVVLWGLAIGVGVHRAHSVPAVSVLRVGPAMVSAENLARKGRLQEALVAFRNIDVPSGLPNRRAQKYHNIGVICMRLQRWHEAEKAFHEALRYDPLDADVHCNLARLAVMSDDQPAALKHVERALALEPGHGGATRLREEIMPYVSISH
jgi:Flp pilus assembly protein TadD